MATTTVNSIPGYPTAYLTEDHIEITIRPMVSTDQDALLDFFRRIPQEDRFYLKEDVTSPAVIRRWADNLDYSRALPLLALMDSKIVGDATLHHRRAGARRHIAEVRVVVDPAYREIGLGRRLIGELLDIAAELGLITAVFELVQHHEELAISAARSMGFHTVAILKGRIRDIWGDHRDLIIMELSLQDYRLSYRY